MLKKIKFIFVAVAIISIFTACSKDSQKSSESVMVAAAASLTDAMNELVDNFKEDYPNIKVDTSYAGSGALQSQIEEGAPIDVFLSAADKQMDALEEKDLIDRDSRVSLLKNTVVLITPKDSKITDLTFENLAEKINKIAIADPASVPIGQYSEEIFKNLNIWDSLQEKIVMSQDVRQSLDWTVKGEVDAATVYKTDAFIEKDNVNIIADAPEGTHKAINYPMAIIKKKKDNEAVKSFYEFLKSDKAMKIFEKYGFKVNR